LITKPIATRPSDGFRKSSTHPTPQARRLRIDTPTVAQ
jgi:hypothetical protein